MPEIERDFAAEWAERIAAAQAEGGKVVAPNGLPIRSIHAFDNMLKEHEHADHPHYQFPVWVEYCGPEVERVWHTGEGKTEPMSADHIYMETHEEHALIFDDGYIAVTVYEYCYAFWYLKDGMCAGGDLWKEKQWKLMPEALAQIKAGPISTITLNPLTTKIAEWR